MMQFEITLTIPLSQALSVTKRKELLQFLAQAIEDRLTEYRDSTFRKTQAEYFNFEGNTLMLQSGLQMEEICL